MSQAHELHELASTLDHAAGLVRDMALRTLPEPAVVFASAQGGSGGAGGGGSVNIAPAPTPPEGQIPGRLALVFDRLERAECLFEHLTGRLSPACLAKPGDPVPPMTPDQEEAPLARDLSTVGRRLDALGDAIVRLQRDLEV